MIYLLSGKARMRLREWVMYKDCNYMAGFWRSSEELCPKRKELTFMKIEELRLKNFKVLRDVRITNLPDMAVFLGVNGSGKSTLFDVFGFLHDSLTDNVKAALLKRGGL